MLSIVLFLLPLVSNGYVFTPAPVTTTSSPNGTIDVQHLHQLLEHEKFERLKLQTEVDDLKMLVTNLTAHVKLTSQGTNTHVRCPYTAFRAQLLHNIGIVRKGQQIKYDRVDLNIGNGFDPTNSIFTAPCDGAYLFSVTLGNNARGGGIFLTKNGHPVEFAFAGFNSGWEMAGLTTVVELVQGDKVWVEGQDYIGGSYSGDPTHLHTGFSGTLVHAD